MKGETMTAIRQQRLRRSRQRCGFKHCFFLCIAAALFQSTTNPSSGSFISNAPAFFPVACAVELRQTQQPTKELDKVKDSTQIRTNDTPLTLNQLLRKAGKKGLGGGIPGFIAGIFQVLSLMWLRTIINYQCRYGTTFREALVTLHNDGGISRLYRGMWFALIQAPLSRFASTASNDGVEALLAGLRATKEWGPARTTVIASVVVGLLRIVLMPVDTCKTVLQVDSMEGFRNLIRRVKAGKISVLYQGSLAMAVSAMVAHYPWFYTFNLLNNSAMVHSMISCDLLRNAGIGVVASFISDTLVNSVRVIKTMKQSMGSKHAVSYLETINMILAADGWKGLFGRGLRTRLYANALQSLVFTVIWRGLSDYWKAEPENRNLKEKES